MTKPTFPFPHMPAGPKSLSLPPLTLWPSALPAYRGRSVGAIGPESSVRAQGSRARSQRGSDFGNRVSEQERPYFEGERVSGAGPSSI